MHSRLTLTTCAVCALLAQTASADDVDVGQWNLRTDSDNSGDDGIAIRGTNDNIMFVIQSDNTVRVYGDIENANTNTVTINDNVIMNDNLGVEGVIYDTNGDFVTVNEGLLVNGATTVSSGGLTVTGATNLNNGLNVDGLTTLDATTIVGTTSVTGATTVTGTTLINTSGSDDTSIGNANSNTTIVGTTSINTTGTATTTIGNSTNATTVTMAGGTSNVSLANGMTEINADGGEANTTIGANGNSTSIQSTNVVVGNNSVSSNISVGTGSASNTIAMGNVQGATVITAAASNTAMEMRDDSITTTLSGDTAGVSAGTVIANNGSQRWIADDNGLLTQADLTDTTSGTTAAMVVTNDSGNTHGLVVQETKTTLSGGTNSASMTLDDRGATFSNPANGRPIQVHGVADGTAPFDAVNVRQLYSGLATVLAAAPDIRLEPGKSGFGVSFGSYGGYEAFGIGLGHMYDNGIVLSASVARGEHSETAAKASISWTW